jgi:hypothetical protein
MGPTGASARLILRRGGRHYWIIVGGLSATLVLLQLAKAAHHPSDPLASAPPVSSHELDSLYHSVEGGTPCPEPMGEDQVAGKDPILRLVAPQVIGLETPASLSNVAPGGSNAGDTLNSTALKPVHPDCPSNGAARNGSAGDRTSVGPRCARPAPTLRRFDSGQVADLRHLRAR